MSELPAVESGPVETHQVPGALSSTWRNRTEWVAFTAVFLVWLLYVLPARGGWERNVVPVASILLIPSLLLLRPWRHCPPWLILAASAPAIGALVVAALAPYGDGGPISLSRWGYFAGVLIATTSFARTAPRRAAVVAALLLAGLHQYAQAWLPWWGGGGTIPGPMVGTIYSANPFGSLMLGFAVAAATVAVLSDSRPRRLGLLVAPPAATAVMLSGARAAILLLAIAAGVLVLLAVRRHGPSGLVRCGVVAALAWGLLTVSTSSLFFAGSQDALAATTAKAASGQTLDSTTGVRVDYWRAAAGQFVDDPLLGGGSGSYAGASRLRMAPGAERSPFAHNEVLGSLAEGGITLGAPVLILFLVCLFLATRVLLRSVGRGASHVEVSAAAAALAVGALLAHSMLDFGLHFPAILALLAVLMGLCVRAHDTASLWRTSTHSGVALAGAALVAVTACGGYLGLSHDRAGVSSLALSGSSVDTPLPAIRDARVILAEARRLARVEQSDREQLRRVEQALRPLARFDGHVEGLRLDLLDRTGRAAEALAVSEGLASRSRRWSPLLLVPYAQRLGPAQGADLLLAEAYLRAAETGRIRSQVVDLLGEAHRLVPMTTGLGWKCAIDALQREGALADETPEASDVDPVVSVSRCQAWAAEATSVLGEPA